MDLYRAECYDIFITLQYLAYLIKKTTLPKDPYLLHLTTRLVFIIPSTMMYKLPSLNVALIYFGKFTTWKTHSLLASNQNYFVAIKIDTDNPSQSWKNLIF